MRCLTPFVVLAVLIGGSSQAAEAPLFERYDLVELTISAPLARLFAETKEDDDFSVKGRLTIRTDPGRPAVEYDEVAIATRGHTSRQSTECEFPKLKVSLPDDAPAGSPLSGMKTLKIGTHCGERDASTLTAKYGRLANEKAAHREALVYRLLESLGVPTLRARPARITYIFTDERSGGRSASAPLVRDALLIEDDDAAVRRFGGTSQIAETEFDSAKTMLAPADAARLAFAEALVGNFDWCLRFTPDDHYRCDGRHPLWNILAIVRGSGSAVPVMYDLDISGMVVGRHTWFKRVFDAAFLASRSPIDIEVLSQLQRTRTLFARDELNATRAAFVARKAAAYQALGDAVVDEEGRGFAQAYLDAFFRVVENDEEFYRPVVVRPGISAFIDAARTQAACGPASRVPVGTPVSEPLERSGDLVRVRLLDVLWQWAPPSACDVIHHEAVWLPADAVSTEFPR